MDKTYDQVLSRGAMLFGFVFLAAKMVVLSLSDPVIICSVGCPFKDTTLNFLAHEEPLICPHSKLNLDILLDLNFQLFLLGYQTSD